MESIYYSWQIGMFIIHIIVYFIIKLQTMAYWYHVKYE